MNSLSAECYSKRGFASLKAGDYKSAANQFRRALELDRERSRRTPEMRYLSYYGFSLAKAGLSGRIALEACQTAVSRQKRDPILYLNLGRVYALTGKTAQALRAFELGLHIAPDHPVLRREMGTLDRRCKPMIPFLGRAHPLNRKLGQLRAHRRGRSLVRSA